MLTGVRRSAGGATLFVCATFLACSPTDSTRGWECIAPANAGGEWSVLFDSPIAIVLWVMVILSLIAPFVLKRKDVPIG